eukprot:Gb_10078 [translate_table: standard]
MLCCGDWSGLDALTESASSPNECLCPLSIDRPRVLNKGCSGLELAVRCSAMAFLRLRRQKPFAISGSLRDRLNFPSMQAAGLSFIFGKEGSADVRRFSPFLG